MLRHLLILPLLLAPLCAHAEYPGHVYGGWVSGYGSYIAPSIRTPPYFSVRPPVYYGDQYARPYGLSPYPAPPMVTAPKSYEGRLMQPAAGCVMVNPHVEGKAAAEAKLRRPDNQARIQANPYVASTARIAQR